MLKNISLYVFLHWVLCATANAAVAETVEFPSRDGKSMLIGYLFKPATPGPHPAVVMLHGRSGPYSSMKPGVMAADNLTGRHRLWGAFWAERGYVALHVDSFGPRGYPRGFPKHSYNSRPAVVSEQTVRPLDAYGALDYLRTRSDVIGARIGLQGWSNGGMTLLTAMGQDAPRVAPELAERARLAKPSPQTDFRAGIALYPSCRTQIKQAEYAPYAPLLITAGTEDDEVSPTVCREFAAQQQARGAPVAFVLYDGAHHSYDDPGKTRQSHSPNQSAMRDSLLRAEAFFREHLKP